MVKRVLSILVGLFVFAIIWGRGSLFWDVWTKEADAARELGVIHIKCLRDHEFLHSAPKVCEKAKDEHRRWPFVRSIGIVIDSTHSCINYPCSDLLRGVFDTWAGIIVVAVIAFTVTFVFATRAVSKYETRQYNRQYEPSPNAWRRQGAVMVAYDNSPGTTTLHLPYAEPERYPSINRVMAQIAGYIPMGGEREKPKLI